jgi:hypothetical protein
VRRASSRVSIAARMAGRALVRQTARLHTVMRHDQDRQSIKGTNASGAERRMRMGNASADSDISWISQRRRFPREKKLGFTCLLRLGPATAPPKGFMHRHAPVHVASRMIKARKSRVISSRCLNSKSGVARFGGSVPDMPSPMYVDFIFLVVFVYHDHHIQPLQPCKRRENPRD